MIRGRNAGSRLNESGCVHEQSLWECWNKQGIDGCGIVYDVSVSSCWCGNKFAVRHFQFEWVWAESDDTTETTSARLA